MKLIFKILISVLVFSFVRMFSILLLSFIPFLNGAGLEIISLIGALAVSYQTWRWCDHPPSSGFMGCVGIGALGAGALGFAGGFFGPMIFVPQANQGPLLGIFITGPLGFLLGAAGGAFYYWFYKRPR